MYYPSHGEFHQHFLPEEPTHSATCDSCSLVRFRGWLKALIPNLLGSSSWGRFALRMPLLITLMNAPMLCQPLLLNHTWRQMGSHLQP